MNAIPIVVLCILPSAAPDDRAAPQISVVRTWKDLLQVKPRAFTKDLRVRIGISRKACPVYGGVTVYCLADGLPATERRWCCQLGPLPLRIERDSFSQHFWALVDAPSIALVGGHKCGEGPALFMHPVVVTSPSDTMAHPAFQFVTRDFGLQFDPATKPQLTIRVLSPDEPDTRLMREPGAIGSQSIEIAPKPQQPWVPLSASGGPQSVLPLASPAWDPLFPVPLPKNLDQPLPSLFPDQPSGKLVLTHTAGKLILRSRFALVDDPREELLARWWRGGKPHLATTGLMRAERVLKSSEHEYTIHLQPAPELTARETLGVQVLYSEPGRYDFDRVSPADGIWPRTRPVPPVVSNRVDLVVGPD